MRYRRTDGPMVRRTDGPMDRRTDGPTNGPTDRRTDKASYRVACPQLKMNLEMEIAEAYEDMMTVQGFKTMVMTILMVEKLVVTKRKEW